VAPDHVLVDRSVAGPFVEALAAVVVEFFGDDPRTSSEYGRIVNRRHHDTVDQVLDATSAVGVTVNHTLLHLLPHDLPFGGVGESGMGAYHGYVGFETFSHRTPVFTASTRLDPRIQYPPYRRVASRLLRRVR